MEVRCQGFVSRAMVQLLCESGIVGVSLHKVMKKLEKEAEKAREQDSIFSLRFQRLM